MNHLKALSFKLIANIIVLSIVLNLLFEIALTNVFLIAFMLTLATYALGDQLILRKTNNRLATAIDFGLYFVLVAVISNTIISVDNYIIGATIAASGISVFEYFFHNYLIDVNYFKRSSNENKVIYLFPNTEISEELITKQNIKSEEERPLI